MKLRIGFVSNSSTSSFVICGFKIPSEGSYLSMMQKILGKTAEEIVGEMKQRAYYKDKAITQDEIESYCADGVHEIRAKDDGVDVEMGEGIDGIIVGISLASPGDYEMEETEINLPEIQKKLEDIRERLGIGDTPIKIFSGCRYN